MSLQEIVEKCKSEKVLVISLIILIGLGSFGLGRLSKQRFSTQPISVFMPGSAVLEEKKIKEMDGATGDFSKEGTGSIKNTESVVASKSGTKYHFPWCAGAKTISEKNKIWFNSPLEAKKAGYEPASNCKGLK